jgi:hypothetical protein
MIFYEQNNGPEELLLNLPLYLLPQEILYYNSDINPFLLTYATDTLTNLLSHTTFVENIVQFLD